MLINNELNVPCPAGFHVMDEKERSKYKMTGKGEYVGLSNPDIHMMITVGVKKLNAFIKLLLKPKDFAKGMRNCIVKGNKPYGIKAEELKDLTLAGAPAKGFSYTYTVRDIAMTGRAYAVFTDNTVYYVYQYVRTEFDEEFKDVFENFLKELKIEGKQK
ncbi:MAG: hypothetical protein K5848_07960 [Lachnospiraceae bacterium]|nr:hypothetical protein [Lachnospiraceae bacterium]